MSCTDKKCLPGKRACDVSVPDLRRKGFCLFGFNRNSAVFFLFFCDDRRFLRQEVRRPFVFASPVRSQKESEMSEIDIQRNKSVQVETAQFFKFYVIEIIKITFRNGDKKRSLVCFCVHNNSVNRNPFNLKIFERNIDFSRKNREKTKNSKNKNR